MSYCRWSSDFGDCDVYVFEDARGGWTTYVAGRRLRKRVPDEIRQIKDLVDSYKAQHEWMRRTLKGRDVTYPAYPSGETTRFEIDDSEYMDLATIGPESGGHYNDPTPGQCADRLERLKAKGFNVPDYAIEALREEQEEMAR